MDNGAVQVGYAELNFITKVKGLKFVPFILANE